METEATAKGDLETGGILMGYWTEAADQVVVTDVVGPGPDAEHGDGWFIPDDGFHRDEAARIYEASGRLHTYLGDWHTHPGETRPHLSFRDQRTLHKIATHNPARAPVALMVVLCGGQPAWHPAAWFGWEIRIGGLLPWLEVQPVGKLRWLS